MNKELNNISLKIYNDKTNDIIFEGLVTDLEINQYTNSKNVTFNTLNIKYDLDIKSEAIKILIG